jgi:hypothetical protein
MLSSFLSRLAIPSRTKLNQLRRKSAARRHLLLEPLENRRVLATLSIGSFDAIKAEGNSGTTPFTFTVSRDVTTAASTVDFTVTGSGANEATADDFDGGAFPTGQVSFAIGEASQTITINVAGDTAFEPNEGFEVTISNPSAGDTIGTAAAQGRINNDDAAGATISIAATSADKAEGNIGTTNFTFTVTRTGVTTGASSVQFDVTGSGANPASGADFLGGGFPTGQVNFAANETTQTVTVVVIGDTDPEPTEGFTVTLSNASAGDSIGTATALGNIQNDDGTAGIATLAIAATDADKAEGNSGVTNFTFTVTRGGDVNHATSVNFAVTGSGTDPAAATDFDGGILPSGTIDFAVGETSQTITVEVAGDVTIEPDEEFTVTLSGASPPDSITTATATGTIQDDDGPVDPATLAIAALDADKAEGNSGTTVFTFVVTRGGNLDHATSVDVAVSGSGASPAEGTDFVGGSFPFGTLNFAPGEDSQSVIISVAGDVTPEANEGFTVTLFNPSTPDTITTATAAGTIQNDDGAAGATLAIAPLDAVKAEGNAGLTAFTFTVTRGGDTTGTSSVNYAVTGIGGSPAAASDFEGGVLPSGSVSFAAGETSQTITVNVAGDTTVEANEGFAVTLSGASPPDTITTSTAGGTIQNDDVAAGATLAIAALDAVKAEGNAGLTAFTFTVTRGGVTTGTSTVNFAVTGSGASPAAATDFDGGSLPSGSVSFAAGETSKTITVNVAGDIAVEADEGFTVTLSGASAPDVITTATANGTILNDDVAAGATLAIAALDATKAEGNAGLTAFTFTVTRGGDTTGTSSVNYAVTGSGGSPAAATDFDGGVLPTGTVVFAAGEISQTITVNVAGDVAVEANEGFIVTLSGASPPDTITTATAIGSILNDDAVAGTTLAIAAIDSVKAEGNAGSTGFVFTVTRSGDTSGTTTVNFAVTGSGASPASGSDISGGVLPSGTITFTAGQTSQTLTVNVAGDTTVEADEGFTVTLSNPSAPATITTATATGTILNDDVAAAVTLDIAAAAAFDFEGDAGTTPFTFTVTRSGDTSGATSVDFDVTGSSLDAAAASDFAGGVLPSGTINFAPGETSQTITVNVRGDLAVEADEEFTVTLSNASGGATINTASDVGTILNDDEPGPGGEIGVDTANVPGASGTARLTADLDNPGDTALVVTGTSGNDVIIVEPRPGNSSQIRVRRNGRVIGNFNRSSVDSIVVFGRGGNDTIIINASLSIDALLFGEGGTDRLFGARGEDGLDGGSGRDFLYGLWGDDELEGGAGDDFLFGGNGNDLLLGSEGNDFLYGEGGHDVLLGGAGTDRLFGGSGRDLLIGGTGTDYLYGGSDDDILIGGSTTHDADQAALLLLLAELRSSSSYSVRVNNLRFGGGANADVVLDSSTVLDDGQVDRLWGDGGRDWFLTGPSDRVFGRASNERVN